MRAKPFHANPSLNIILMKSTHLTPTGHVKSCLCTLFSSRHLAAAFLSVALFASAHGALVFEENWSEETLGDNLSELTNWTSASTDGSIVDLGDGEKGLSLTPASGKSIFVNSNQTVAISGSNEWTFSFDLSIGSSPAASNGVGLFLQDATTKYQYRFFVDVSSNSATSTMFHIQRYNGSTYTNFSYLSALKSLNGDGMHTYSIVMSEGETETVFGVYLDGNLLGTVIDSNPITISEAQLRLVTQSGLKITYGDITAVPEPASSSIILLVLAGLTTYGYRSWRRRKA